MHVLIAYGSKRGGTAGLAAMIGDAFADAGWEVDVCRAADVHDLTGFDAVVVAGALYMNRWHRDARRFVSRCGDRLRELPVWLVSSGPLDDSADAGDLPAVAAGGEAGRPHRCSRPYHLRWPAHAGCPRFSGERDGADEVGGLAKPGCRAGMGYGAGEGHDGARIEQMFDTLAGWVGTTDRRAGARCSGCSTASRAAPACRWTAPDADGGDSPAWSRKREDYRAAASSPVRSCSVPYAELHAHSAYSFLDGASTPEELVEEAVRLDLRAIALTDHDGLYGVVRFAEAASELDMRTVFGAELSLGDGARTERPGPARPAPAGAGPRAGGLPPAVPATGRGAPGRRREGQAALRLRRAHRGRRRALAHSHRMPQRPCAPGTFAGRSGGCRRRRWPTWWTGSGATGSVSSSPTTAIRSTTNATPRWPRWRRASASVVIATTAAHFAEPSRGRLAMAMGAIRARQSLDEARRMAGAAGRGAPALRRRDGPAVRAPSRSGHRRRRTGGAVRVRAAAHRTAAAAVRRARRAHRGQLAAGAGDGRRRATATARRAGRREGLRADRARAERHRSS